MNTKTLTKATAGPVLALALVAGLSACGSSNSSNSSSSNGGSGSGGGPAAGGPGSGIVHQQGQRPRLSGQITGDDLMMDVQAPPVPSTYKVDTVNTTGDGHTVDMKLGDPSAMDCNTAFTDFGEAGSGETGGAVTVYTSTDGKSEYEWTLFSFPSAAAAQHYVQAYEQKYQSCGKFTLTSSGSGTQVNASVDPASDVQVPDADTAAQVVGADSGNGHTATLTTLLATDGNVVALVTSASIDGATLPASPTLSSIAQTLFEDIYSGQSQAAELSGAAGPSGGAS